MAEISDKCICEGDRCTWIQEGEHLLKQGDVVSHQIYLNAGFSFALFFASIRRMSSGVRYKDVILVLLAEIVLTLRLLMLKGSGICWTWKGYSCGEESEYLESGSALQQTLF